MANDASITAAIRALPPLRQVIASNRLTARRGLAQNFINDLNLTQRIVAAAEFDASHPQATIIEIGAGAGGLTRAILLAGARRVIAIEKDSRAIAALQPLVAASQGRLQLLAADAKNIAINKMGQPPRHIIANLPYNIATLLLMDWLDHASDFASMTLMFQREVAARIIAQPNTSAYGRLAVMCQWLCDARLLFDIPPAAFVPQPKVTSSLVSLVPRPKPAYPAHSADLQDITRLTFGQRRKMLRAALRAIGGDALLAQAAIEGSRRPQELCLAEFCRLANAYGEAKGKGGD